jgi:hypothetical protein
LIEEGGLAVSGHASLTGIVIMIYNTSSNNPSGGGNFGGITRSGNGTVNLTASSTTTGGVDAGILIFQPTADTWALSFSGNGKAVPPLWKRAYDEGSTPSLVEDQPMPVHDWTRVNPGLFHHFHQMWIAALCNYFNSGNLPGGYYALAEQVAGGPIPDVLTLQSSPPAARPPRPNGDPVLATAAPRTRFVQRAQLDAYARRADRLVIRHPLGNVVALLEIVSPGNKSSKDSLRTFVEKTVAFLRAGIHVLVVDLFPPTKRDPQGIHKAIWDQLSEEPFALPPDKPLSLASYCASDEIMAYVEPVAVGDALPSMPLYLKVGEHIDAPLETTYQATWTLCPEPLKEAVERCIQETGEDGESR